MKVGEIIETILKEIKWRPENGTVDNIITGSSEMEVEGIVTTCCATLDVIKKAKKLGANFIISHEPTFYNHSDKTDWIKDSPILKHKWEETHNSGVTIWRFHDHMHKHNPDLIYKGTLKALGWEQYWNKNNRHLVNIPETSLEEIIDLIKDKLECDRVKVIGNINNKIKNVAVSFGYSEIRGILPLLESESIELHIVGESAEWELSEYFRDANSMGLNKAMIVVGHWPSEEKGMEYLKEWLDERLSDIPTNFIKAGYPFQYI